MAEKRGLGRGLGSLLTEYNQLAEPSGTLRDIPLQRVEPNPDQPRQDFDDEELQALADSIAEHGILQPLTVREIPMSEYYQIIAGERRWRAARLAGLITVPALVIEADNQKATELALVENLQRQDLNPVEEALGYQSLIDDYGLTQEEAARRVGKSRPVVANALRLLNLEPEILKLLKEGKLSQGHARAILSLKDPKKRREAAQKITALDLSVRQTEALCRQLSREPKPEPAEQPLRVDYVAECEKNLSHQLGRGVKIVSGKRKGRFELEFYGPEDLQRLYEALQSLPKEARREI